MITVYKALALDHVVTDSLGDVVYHNICTLRSCDSANACMSIKCKHVKSKESTSLRNKKYERQLHETNLLTKDSNNF
jgi:hypothetical protein